MKKLFTKIIILIVCMALITPYYPVSKLAQKAKMVTPVFAYDANYIPSYQLVENLSAINNHAIQSGYAEQMIDFGNSYDNNNIAIKYYDAWKKITSSSQDMNEYNLNRNNWLKKNYPKLPMLDQKIIDPILKMTAPIVGNGFGNKFGRLGIDRINKGHTTDKDGREYSDENTIANLGDAAPEGNNISRHYNDISQAIDIDALGQTKCTQVTCDDDPNDGNDVGNGDGRCQENEIIKDGKKALPAVNNQFKKILKDNSLQSKADPNQVSSNNNLAQILGAGVTLSHFFSSGSKNDVFQFLNSNSGLSNSDQLAKISPSNLPDNGAGMASIIGYNILLDELGLNGAITTPYVSFKDFITTQGQEALYEIFNKNIPQSSFKGTNAEDWLTNIGSTELENRLGLPNSSLISGDNQTLTTAGQRVMEDILGLSPNSLKNVASNYNDLTKQIGQGYIEKNLYLPVGSFASDDVNEIKKVVGADKYDDIFAPRNYKIISTTLGLDNTVLSNNINNIAELKKLVGERVIEQKIKVFEENEIKLTDGTGFIELKDIKELGNNINNILNLTTIKLDSRDEMLGLVNYKKPEVDFNKKVITTFNYQNGETTEVPFIFNVSGQRFDLPTTNFVFNNQNTQTIQEPTDSNYTYTYEKLLYNIKNENSLTKKFLSGENLADTYNKIGAIRVAKGLSSIEDEQLYIYHFLTTGKILQKEIKYNDDIKAQINTFDPQEVAKRIGLSDWFDLYKIFRINHGYEIYPYLGEQKLASTINPDVTIDTNYQQEDFVKDKLSTIQSITDDLTKQNVKDDIKVHLDNALKAFDEESLNNFDDLISHPPLWKVSNSLKNIGNILQANNLTTSETAKNIYRQIYEINLGYNIPDWHPNADNLSPILSLGVKSSNLHEYFDKSEDQLNIDEIAIALGAKKLNYAFDLDETFAQTEIKVKSLTINHNTQAQEVLNTLGENSLATVANNLNASLYLPNDEKLSSTDIAHILIGNWVTVTRKLADKRLSSQLDIPFIQLLEGNSSVVAKIDDEIFSNSNIADYQINTMRTMVSSVGSLDYASQNIKNGFNYLAGTLVTNTLTAPNEMNNVLYQFQNYLLKGKQTIGYIKNIQDLKMDIGENIANTLLSSGDLNKSFKELGAIKYLDKLRGELSNFSNLGIDLNSIREMSGLRLPGLDKINQWITDNFGQMGSILNNVYGDLYNMGIVDLIRSNGQNINFAYADVMLQKIDKNIPSGFARAMFSDDEKSKIQLSSQLMKNNLKNPSEDELAAIDALTKVMSGNKDANTLSSAVIDYAMQNKDFSKSLENIGVDKNTLRGALSSIGNKTMDKNTGLSLGKGILLANMKKNEATTDEMNRVSVVFDLLRDNVTAASGISAVFILYSSNQDFKDGLSKIGFTTDSAQSFITSIASGNFDEMGAATVVKNVVTKNMKDKKASDSDIALVSRAIDMISNGATVEGGLDLAIDQMTKDQKLLNSIKDTGLEVSDLKSMALAVKNGNLKQAATTTLTKVAKYQMKAKGATDKQIGLVDDALSIIDGGASPEKIVSIGFKAVDSKELRADLDKAGVSFNSIEKLASVAVSGKMDQSSVVSFVGEVTTNKITGTKDKAIANSIIQILEGGGTVDASKISNVAITAWGDDIDKIFPSNTFPDGFGRDMVRILASGNPDAAVGALKGVAGNYISKELTKAVDNMLKTTAGTTTAIHESLHSANKALAESKNKLGDFAKGDKKAGKDFLNLKATITNMAISMATSLVIGSLLQNADVPPWVAETLSSVINALILGVNPVTAVLTTVLPYVFGAIGIPIPGFSSGKQLKEVYCAMDYYPWLESPPDYSDVIFWPEENSPEKDGYKNFIASKIGENLPDRPPYEFKANPGEYKKKVEEKMPWIVNAKFNFLTYAALQMPTKLAINGKANDEVLVNQLLLPQLKSTKIGANVCEQVFANHMYPLDLKYGELLIDYTSNLITSHIKTPMTTLLKKGEQRRGALCDQWLEIGNVWVHYGV